MFTKEKLESNCKGDTLRDWMNNCNNYDKVTGGSGLDKSQI